MPLFSLHSKKSCGIGEFEDLIPLIDWCKQRGFDCLQLLPLNDTAEDPSPYNPISSCALDPIYLSLSSWMSAEELASFSAFNKTSRVERKEIKEKKMKWLARHFLDTFPSLSKTDSFQTFVSQNKWLSSYASFKALSEEQGGASWKTWPHPEKKIKQETLDFHFFLQYLCFSQMQKVQGYAAKQGVLLQGDVPILLSFNSADVWSQTNLFQLDATAGAPPDYYTPRGQNWGFPLFDWEAMRNTHFAWWKERLTVMEKLYHLYRIDHVVGFFRIWAIPLGKKPTQGSFVPQKRSLWLLQGKEILNMMLDSCHLLPIAEDLGTIPEELYPALKNLGICGTKVIRWQKDKEQNYIPYDLYEPLSMTTVSTCDCDTLRMWWKNFPDEAKDFARFKHWDYTPDLSYEKLLLLLRDAHHTPSYFHINLLQEYLSLFPELVWEDGQNERINIPGTTLATNWTYRFRPSLEEIIEHQGLKTAIEAILHG